MATPTETTTLLFLPPGRAPASVNAAVASWAERLRAEVPTLEVLIAADEAEARSLLERADAAYGTLPDGWAGRAPRLRWLQAPMAAPPVGFFTEELAAHPVVVTNMRGVYNDHIATHVLAFVLAFARGLPGYAAQQRDHRYRATVVPTVHLAEARLLLIGAGGVGTTLARYLAPFGTEVVAVDARVTEAAGIAVHPAEALDELLPTADFVVSTVPHTPDTEAMMDRARFARMKATAVFVNIGRGMTVRLRDLVDALQAGELAGAGLDVFDEEPLPADHPLWDVPNVLITPHVAMNGPYIDERRYDVIAENCRRFLAGEELFQVVDKRRWF
ncbi:MAG: D-2-hydroxyacid dehydrogenase [Acidimicrobiales bacterium]|nr:D-2-hydroxyacid dehydrogenase [Acidimicrobiales bacterium]